MRFKILLTALLIFYCIARVGAQEVKEQANTGTVEEEKASSEKQEGQNNTSGPAKIKNNDPALKPLVIKAKRVKTMDKASTTSTVTAEDIEARSSKLLKDVLTQIPGIQVSEQMKGTTKYTMRGYDMSKVALLIDGIPIINSYDGTIDINNIGIMDVSEIVVNRGSASALYGARGTVGSINIAKKEPSELYANASAEYGEHGNYVTSFSNGAPLGNFFYYISGTYDKQRGYTVSKKLTYSERLKWLKKLSQYDRLGVSLNLEAENNRDMFYYLNDTGLWDHTSSEKYKVYGKAGYHVTPELEIGVSSFYNKSKMENSHYQANSLYNYCYIDDDPVKKWSPPYSDCFRNMSTRWPEYDDYAVSPYLTYSQGNFDLRINTYFYKQSNWYVAYSDPEETAPYNSQQKPQDWTWSIWTNKTYGIDIYPSYQVSPWNRINFSLSYYDSTHIEEEKALNDDSEYTLIIYGNGKYRTSYIEAAYLTLAAEDEIRMFDNTEFTLGVSYDAQNLTVFQRKKGYKEQGEPSQPINSAYYQMVDTYEVEKDSMLWGTRDAFSPVAGIVFEPFNDLLKLKGSASRKISFPTLQNYANTISNYDIDYGTSSKDVQIKPEKSTNCNAGFELSFLDRQFTFGADYFYSKFSDKIIKIYDDKNKGDNNCYIYRNLDAMDMQGAESTLGVEIRDIFNITDIKCDLTYTYIYARNLTDIENSFVNKGKKLENIPEHKLTFDFRMNFYSDTSLIIFGYLEYKQYKYVMASTLPANGSTGYSTSYFKAERLHDPLFIDIKLSQKIYYNYECYVMCKNVLDDYGPDPFNPGAGRMWYGGLKVSI